MFARPIAQTNKLRRRQQITGESVRQNKRRGDALVEFVKDGLREVQNTGIGGGISKGYGEVEFRDLKLDGQDFNL